MPRLGVQRVRSLPVLHELNRVKPEIGPLEEILHPVPQSLRRRQGIVGVERRLG